MGNLWAGVVRVSFMGERKAGADNFHADREQVETVKRYAAGHGAQVEFLPPELSVSGGKPIAERPSLRAAIEGVEAGVYSGVVVAYLSRLTRSRSGLEIWDRVEAAGGHVHCAAENLDTSTPNGRFIRDVHLANAVREREEHVDRFEQRRMHATAAGIWQRRQTPAGYRRDEQTRRLVPDERAREVLAAFELAHRGEPIVQIADRLRMTPGGVRHLLSNRVYLGELRVGGHVNPAAHPAIVSVELFDAVQPSRPRPARRPSKHRAPALLARIVRCEACGHAMTRGGNGAGTYINYVCQQRTSHGRCPAPASISTKVLDPYVEEIAVQQLDELRVRSSELDAGIDAAREALTAAEGELGAYLAATAALDVDAAALRAGAQERQRTVDAAREDLRHRQAARPVGHGVTSGSEAWEKLDGHGRNALLRALLEVVIVRRVGRGHRVAIADRVRVVAYGTGLPVPVKQGDAPMPIRALPWPDVDGEGVLRVLSAE